MNAKSYVSMVIALMLVAAPFLIMAEGTQSFDGAVTGGTFGEDNKLRWSFDSTTNDLTINGQGAMGDFTEDTVPWKAYRVL